MLPTTYQLPACAAKRGTMTTADKPPPPFPASALAGCPRPPSSEMAGLARYEDLDPSERSLLSCEELMERKREEAADAYTSICGQRPRRPGLTDLLFRKRKFKALRKNERVILLCLWAQINHNSLLGLRYLRRTGWLDGDELFYYAFTAQVRNFDEHVLLPLKRLSDAGNKEIPPGLTAQVVSAIKAIYQALSDASADFYRRLRPSWTPAGPSDLPAPFCPLALSVREDKKHPFAPLEPPPELGADVREQYWACPECSALTKKVDGTAEHKDPLRTPFAGHLRAAEENEEVEHACSDCFEVYADHEDLNSHVFDQWFEKWSCLVVPERLPPHQVYFRSK